jgi:hypothetical protein
MADDDFCDASCSTVCPHWQEDSDEQAEINAVMPTRIRAYKAVRVSRLVRCLLSCWEMPLSSHLLPLHLGRLMPKSFFLEQVWFRCAHLHGNLSMCALASCGFFSVCALRLFVVLRVLRGRLSWHLPTSGFLSCQIANGSCRGSKESERIPKQELRTIAQESRRVRRQNLRKYVLPQNL